MNRQRIPTEILQLFSSKEAWEYFLVPFGQDGDLLRCYGDKEKNYDTVMFELEIISGQRLEIVPIEKQELHQLLKSYYRTGQATLRPDTAFGSNNNGFLDGLIEEAHKNGVSDIHFESYEERCRLRFRIDGRLTESYVVEKEHYMALINQIKIIAGMDISEKRLPQDGRIFYQREEQKFDVRVSSLPTIYGEKMVLRLLTRRLELLELENLGFDEKQLADYTEAIRKPNGLILISGPTGSGKSTTLYATLRLLNKEHCNILTIEDPVEYTLSGVNQVQLKEEIGLTFGSALRTFLRQDPDIIMLGEIRDPDTATMAVRSSLTGHLLLSTIHTNSAWGSVSRLTDMGIHPYLLSDTLILCVAQRLVRLLCPHCKQVLPSDDRMEALLGDTTIKTQQYKAVGCEHCFFTGYHGRKAVYEVIPIDTNLAEAIRKSGVEISSYLKQQGIRTLKDSVISLFLQGETSLEELLPLISNDR